MNILVCVRRVPDTSENEIQLNSDQNDIERDDLVYSVNEWDNYAVEEALRIVGEHGGQVTVVTVGGDDDEEILRREMAMGAIGLYAGVGLMIVGVLLFAARLAKKRGLGRGNDLIEIVSRQRLGRTSTVNVVRIADVVLDRFS